MRKLISIVAPCYNEQECLYEFHRRLVEVIEKHELNVEIILIDDGSTDNTWPLIKELARKDPRVRGVSLSRNFGHQASLKSGYEMAKGAAVICMDSDLQHPPEIIPRLVEVWESGYSVVNTIRRYTGKESFIKRATSTTFYRLFAFLSGMPFRPGIADFRLLDHQVTRALRDMPERNSSLRFAVQWMGFRQAYIDYWCGQRFAGTSKYNFWQMLRFGMRSIVQFSVFPLRLSFILSGLASLLFLAYGGYALYAKFVTGGTAPGWTSLILTISLLAALQFLAIGLLGEYVGVIYDEVKRRPVYYVREVVDYQSLDHKG